MSGATTTGRSACRLFPDGVEASAWVNASDDSINPLFVGRHNAVEVFLPADPELSLRHLVVILHRRGAGPIG